MAHTSGADTRLTAIAVKRGDTLDFVVSSRGDVNSDGFLWAPVLEASAAAAGTLGVDTHWDAAADFAGPATAETPRPTGAWEAFAQALLLTNEFLFID